MQKQVNEEVGSSSNNDQFQKQVDQIIRALTDASNEEETLVDDLLRVMAATWVEDAGNVYLLAIERFLKHGGQTPLEIMSDSSVGREIEGGLEPKWKERFSAVRFVVSTPAAREFHTTVRGLIQEKRHYEAADHVIRGVRDGLVNDPGVAFDYCVAVYPHRKHELAALFFGSFSKVESTKEPGRLNGDAG